LGIDCGIFITGIVYRIINLYYWDQRPKNGLYHSYILHLFQLLGQNTSLSLPYCATLVNLISIFHHLVLQESDFGFSFEIIVEKEFVDLMYIIDYYQHFDY
jgi:hypothetical protein